MKTKKTKSAPTPPPPQKLSECFLEHAARETSWMAQNAKECNYGAAAAAEVRRGVWLMAALIAQERKL